MGFGKIVVSFTSDMMDYVDVEAHISLGYSVINGYVPSSLSHISSIGSSEESAEDAIEFCQCPQNEDEAFIACCICGSFFEPRTYCPLLCDHPIIED